MKITQVRLTLVDNDPLLKAYVSIIFDDCFVVKDLKLINGPTKGLYVAMPSKKIGSEYRDMAHPLNVETRRMIHAAVMEQYSRERATPTSSPHSRA